MAAKIEQCYYDGQACNLRITVGSLDAENESYEINEYQIKNLQIAISYWLHDLEKGCKLDSVLVQDDGSVHIIRKEL